MTLRARFPLYLLASTLLAGVAASLGATTLGAQQAASALTSPLPVDPMVKIGRLPNGIRYYVRKNSRPE